MAKSPAAAFSIAARVIVTGSVSDYDDPARAAIATKVADELHVPTDRVSVLVQPASVQLTILVDGYNSQPSTIGDSSKLRSLLIADSLNLEPISVEVAIAVVGAAPPWAPLAAAVSPPPQQAIVVSDDNGSLLVAGGVAGGVVVLLATTALLLWGMRVRRLNAKKFAVSPDAPANPSGFKANSSGFKVRVDADSHNKLQAVAPQKPPALAAAAHEASLRRRSSHNVVDGQTVIDIFRRASSESLKLASVSQSGVWQA